MIENLTLKESPPLDNEITEMIKELDQYQESLYPPTSNHLDSITTLSQPNCKLMAAYKGEKLIGIGAAKLMDGYGELKRFFVSESFRGQGVAELFVATLEAWLLESEISICKLETGIHQHAAIRFYEKLGYKFCEPFGDYQIDPLSVFMEKYLL